MKRTSKDTIRLISYIFKNALISRNRNKSILRWIILEKLTKVRCTIILKHYQILDYHPLLIFRHSIICYAWIIINISKIFLFYCSYCYNDGAIPYNGTSNNPLNAWRLVIKLAIFSSINNVELEHQKILFHCLFLQLHFP